MRGMAETVRLICTIDWPRSESPAVSGCVAEIWRLSCVASFKKGSVGLPKDVGSSFLNNA